ncbi:MAG: HAD family phosphatase [bacterium]|nr:MAG: HAD family phosphatase [bacterium]
MKAILFDFDGVLVQSMEDHFQGWRKALEKFGIEMNPEELYVMEGQGVKAVAHELTRKYNLPIESSSELIKDKQDYYNKIKKIRFYPNLLEVLNWATEKNLRMGVVTGGTRDRVNETIQNFGLDSFFGAIVTSDDVSETKPSPQPYLLAASLLDTDPKECIVIENAPLGIQSGKSAGMRVIGLTTTLNSHHLKEADVVVGDFRELLAALKRLY